MNKKELVITTLTLSAVLAQSEWLFCKKKGWVSDDKFTAFAMKWAFFGGNAFGCLCGALSNIVQEEILKKINKVNREGEQI